MKQLNPLICADCPPVAILDEAGEVIGWKNEGLAVKDFDPRFRGVFPHWEVHPVSQDHDFGEGAVKIVAPSEAELLAAAVAAVEAGTAPADLIADVPTEDQ